MIERWTKSNLLYKCTFFALIILFLIRIMNIDQDLPPYGIGYLYAGDEGSYATLALNYENYGDMKASSSKYEFFVSNHLKTDIVGNLFTIISMQIFGDNYLGFRLPSLIFSAIIFISFGTVIYNILKRNREDWNLKRWILPACMLYVLCDFFLYNASRVWEPTIQRLCFAMLALLVVSTLEKKTNIKIALLMGIVSLSVLGVYVTNAFLFLPCLVVVLQYVLTIDDKKKRIKVIAMSIGVCLLVFIGFDIFYRCYWGVSYLENFIGIFTSFSGNTSYTVLTNAGIIQRVLARTVNFFSGNILLYNIPVLALFLLQIPCGMHYMSRKRDYVYSFASFSVFGLWIQTLVTEDFIGRKVYVIYMFMLVCILISKQEFLMQKVSAKREKAYVIIVMLFIFYIVYYKIWGITDSSNLDFSNVDIALIISLQLIPGIFIILGRLSNRESKKLTLVCVIGSLLFNVCFIGKYIWLNKTFTDKEMMISLGEKYNEQYVAGAYSMGFSLYNDIKPVVNTKEKYEEFVLDNQELLFFEIGVDVFPYIRKYLDKDIMNDGKYYLLPYEEYERDFLYYGEHLNMMIYIPKEKQV